MDGHRCVKCETYWASTATGQRVDQFGKTVARFQVTIMFCPDCIAKAPAIQYDLFDDPRYDAVERRAV